VNGEDKYKRGEIFDSQRSRFGSDRKWQPCKNPFLTNCKFRETVFCNHNHHYNISRSDILAYVPIERDEGPTWVPPPKPPPPPPMIKKPKVVVKIPEKPIPEVKVVEPPKPKKAPV